MMTKQSNHPNRTRITKFARPLSVAQIQGLFHARLAFQRQGRLEQARAIYQQLLSTAPGHIKYLNKLPPDRIYITDNAAIPSVSATHGA